ncbi:MAG: hypothetical protein HY000_19015 [Planctomycetes bacterium]|nr:hypothetical protein [Planctomycetota bacterium]
MDEFLLFGHKMSGCLRRAEAVVTGERQQIRYRIAGLETGSAGMTVEAIAPKKGPDRRMEVVGLFKKTVADLQAGAFTDPRWTLDDLRGFRELIAPLKRTKQVWVDGQQLTSQYIANIDKILGSSVGAEGFVSGRLERLNVHNRNEFVLYPPIIGASIVCHFPDELFERVRDAIKRSVTVCGTLFYVPDKPFPDRVHVRALEIHPPDDELPKLRELRGSFRGCTDGLSSVEFVRSTRDEQEN